MNEAARVTTNELRRMQEASYCALKDILVKHHDFHAKILPTLPSEVRVLPLRKIRHTGLAFESTSLIDSRKKLSDNAGNYIWQHGSTALLNPLTCREIRGDEAPDATIVAAANLFHLNNNSAMNDMTRRLTNVVNQHKVPTIVMGLGVQARFGDEDRLQLSQVQHQFLSAVMERQTIPAIGARGECTRKGCQSVNISHCVPMGCPSLTINRAEHLGDLLRHGLERVKEKLRNKERLNIGMAAPAPFSFHQDPLLNQFLVSVGSYHNVTVVMQHEEDQNTLERYQRQLNRTDVNFHFNLHSEIKQWTDDLSEMDVMLSTRIHGGMAAIMAGTPAIVVPTDLRIVELINAMRIPYLKMEQIQGKDVADPLKLLEVLEDIQFGDFDEFERNRREKIRQWKVALDSAGIETDPGLLRIIQD